MVVLIMVLSGLVLLFAVLERFLEYNKSATVWIMASFACLMWAISSAANWNPEKTKSELTVHILDSTAVVVSGDKTINVNSETGHNFQEGDTVTCVTTKGGWSGGIYFNGNEVIEYADDTSGSDSDKSDN